MSPWKHRPTAAAVEAGFPGTLGGLLDMRFEGVGDDFLALSMPVDARTHQPMGVLHGGASVALAETAGSVAANFCLPPEKVAMGQEINANHLRPVTTGRVVATARPFHLGAKSQVWGIEIRDARGALVCVSRLTMAVIDRPAGYTAFLPGADAARPVSTGDSP